MAFRGVEPPLTVGEALVLTEHLDRVTPRDRADLVESCIRWEAAAARLSWEDAREILREGFGAVLARAPRGTAGLRRRAPFGPGVLLRLAGRFGVPGTAMLWQLLAMEAAQEAFLDERQFTERLRDEYGDLEAIGFGAARDALLRANIWPFGMERLRDPEPDPADWWKG